MSFSLSPFFFSVLRSRVEMALFFLVSLLLVTFGGFQFLVSGGYGYSSSIMTPPMDVHVPMLRTYEYVTLPVKGDFADVIELRTLSWGNDSGLSRWATYIARVLKGGRQEGQSQRLEDGGWGHEPRDAGTSRSWKRQGNHSPLKSPEGTPCNTSFYPSETCRPVENTLAWF